MTDIRRRTLLASALIPVGLLAVMLYIQDQRQGWPFSRHTTHTPAVAQAAPQPAGESASDLLSARAPVDMSARQIDMLGVQTELVDTQRLDDPMRAVATVVADESRVVHVHTRVSGWLEELYVNTTGQQVRAGQPLGGVFSQELYSSQSEYLSALRRAGSGPASAVLDAARTRLTLLGMSDAEIARIENTGEVRRLVTIAAPINGVVLNRGVTQGTAIDPSTEILTIADLSRVWVIAEVAEGDAAHISTGSTATLRFPTSGREPFTADVEFVYLTLTERTRTVRVRMSVPNTDGGSPLLRARAGPPLRLLAPPLSKAMRILLAALLMVAALGLLLAMVAGAVEPSLGSALAAYAGMLAGMVLAAAEAMARWG